VGRQDGAHSSSTSGKTPWGLAFSPDGKRFVTGSQAGTAKVWDLQSGRELFTLSGHTSTVYRVAYSPDGTLIATAAYDSTAKVWDAATGKLLLTLYGATKGINGITFSLDGKRLITVSDDGNMRTYPLGLEDELALAHSRLTRTWRLEECQQYLHVAQCPQL
jgi:WD40 repeat protein